MSSKYPAQLSPLKPTKANGMPPLPWKTQRQYRVAKEILTRRLKLMGRYQEFVQYRETVMLPLVIARHPKLANWDQRKIASRGAVHAWSWVLDVSDEEALSAGQGVLVKALAEAESKSITARMAAGVDE